MQSLLRLGHKVTLLTMCTQKHGLTEQEREKLTSQVRLHTAEVKTAVTPHGFLGNLLFSKKPYNAVRFIARSFERTLSRVLQLSVFDVVQLEGLYLMPYTETIRQHSNAIIVLRAHNVEQEIWSRIALQDNNAVRKWYFGLLARRIREFETAAVNRYDLLVPITERDLDAFTAMGSNKPARVIPAGIEITGELPGPPTGKLDLFFLGSLDWKPNQEGLLWFAEHVFPTLFEQYPDLLLHVAGRNAPSWLVKELRKPGLVYHGEVPDSATFIASHGILVAPCFSGSGMRVKILESMSLGRPVVTTSVGAEGLGTRDGGHFIVREDPQEFRSAVINLLSDPELYNRIARKGFEFAGARFDNLSLARELTEFYQSAHP
jgi:glycosyltransferase involved in cell wall biosynthesis